MLKPSETHRQSTLELFASAIGLLLLSFAFLTLAFCV